ncbi:Sds3-like-domain-containing protein [Sphaerosporella brunnea]|uniref:Sds3-like-domain-containing protein n=1 Tax=Sphaerosporella brunnea TaxID=1250544 RepID=A0A5J5F0A3_9PEZI|nr:Sds3-like-domain-containing protein [Sphaerosporella brunnea]
MDEHQIREDDAEDEDPDVPPSAPPEDEAGDSADATREDDEDAEKEAKKQKAIEELAEIEKIFAKLKDSIYNDKLHRVEIEMKMLADGTHPEYVAQKKVIDERLEKKVRLADMQYKHAMESLQISTNVSRAQIHSQFYQATRELRENALQHCSELWYAIQRERRATDALVSEYTYRIPDRQSTRVKHRMQYNWEVQILGGIQRHIGFPAAPDVNGATEEEMAEDLEALRIHPAAPARAATARSVAPPNVTRIDDLAHHSWANAHSPPSPAIHVTAQQQQQQPAHAHPRRHHHHHHHPSQQGTQRPNQQEQTTYHPPPPRRQGSSLGPPPSSSSASLSSLLHPQQEGGVKVEGQSAQQTSLPPFKSTDAFTTFTPHLTRPSPFSMGHMHPFARNNNGDSQHGPLRMDGRRSPTPGERMMSRDQLELDSLKREVGQAPDRLGSIGGAGLRGPIYRPGGGLSYS